MYLTFRFGLCFLKIHQHREGRPPKFPIYKGVIPPPVFSPHKRILRFFLLLPNDYFQCIWFEDKTDSGGLNGEEGGKETGDACQDVVGEEGVRGDGGAEEDGGDGVGGFRDDGVVATCSRNEGEVLGVGVVGAVRYESIDHLWFVIEAGGRWSVL